tara:strand:+ start:1165 stop:2394 length:1230 start_codon:yes stop_codon:yes gene_type:complete
MLDRYRLHEVSKETLELLVSEAVAECRTLDFKVALPSGKDSDRKEFSADAASFANSAGGNIVFGVAEDKGVAVDVCGLDVQNVDQEILRLQNMLRSGVDPRVDGVEFRPVAGFRLGPAIVMRIPRSWNAPHMVTACGSDSRFYARSGAQKAPLDVHQIRAAFLGSQLVADRIRRFRDERLGRIVGDDTPFPLVSTRRVALHLIPFSAMNPGARVDLGQVEESRVRLRPIGANGWNDRYNLDGFATVDDAREGGARGYVQVFRHGMIEAVDTLRETVPGCWGRDEETPVIPGVAFPRDVLTAVWEYMQALEGLGSCPPVAVFLALTGARGSHVYMSPRYTMEIATCLSATPWSCPRPCSRSSRETGRTSCACCARHSTPSGKLPASAATSTQTTDWTRVVQAIFHAIPSA